jgi:hypothetical protein
MNNGGLESLLGKLLKAREFSPEVRTLLFHIELSDPDMFSHFTRNRWSCARIIVRKAFRFL